MNKSYFSKSAAFISFLFLAGQPIVQAQQIDTTLQATLTELVVKGNFPAYIKAIQWQRNAAGIESMLNLDLPGRFPDLNPAEALQRLPGIVLERSEGEGRYVHIRGAAPSLTTVQVNGEQIISPESKSRFLQFDLLPVDQLSAVEVYKTNLPDQDGDAIGGSINLLTLKTPSGPIIWRAAVAGGYNPAAGLPNGQAQLALSGRHLSLNASVWQDHRATDNVEKVYGLRDFGSGNELWINNLELRHFAVARRRVGFTGDYVLPFKDQSGQVYFRSLLAHFSEINIRQRLRYRPETGLTVAANDTIFGASLGRDVSYVHETEHLISIQTGGEHSWRRWKADAAAAFSYGVESEPVGQTLEFQLPGIDLFPDHSNQRFPRYSITNGLAEDQYEKYAFCELQLESDHSTDRSYTVRANAQWSFQRTSDYLKFGLKARTRQKRSSASERFFDNYNGNDPLLLTNLLQTDRFYNFLGDHYAFGRRMNVSNTRKLIANHAGYFQLNEGATAMESTPGNFNIREQSTAGYIMAHFQRGHWEWSGGMRLEHTQYAYLADKAIIDSVISVLPLGQAYSGRYTFLLPTITAKFLTAKNWQWRGVVGASYARPGFDQIAPYELFRPLDGTVVAGNPQLKPAFAWNADISLEKFLNHGGAITAALFGKRIERFIFTQQGNDTRLWKGNLVNVLATKPVNGGVAWLAGIELNWQQQLLFLPGPWSGLGVYANYTFTWSHASADDDDQGMASEDGFRLPGQSPHSGNIALWYDHNDWSGRIALNFQGDFLLQATEPEDAILQQIYGSAVQLDLNLSYAFDKHWMLFAEGMNLLNTPLRYFTGDKKHLSKLEYYGAWGRAGVKFTWQSKD